MEWDRLFEDLEDQLASDAEGARAALDAESERLRIVRLTLRDRLSAFAAARVPASATLVDGTVLRGRIRETGADWTALDAADGRSLDLVPAAAVAAWSVEHPALLSSTAASAGLSPLRARMTLGYVLRHLARRRVGVTVRMRSGALLSGTIDRAGADHLDLALHDPGAPRRAQEVRGFRIVPFAAVVCIGASAATAPFG